MLSTWQVYKGPAKRNIVARLVLHTFGSSLKMVTFLLQHILMLQDVACVWPVPSQNLSTILQDVALKCFLDVMDG